MGLIPTLALAGFLLGLTVFFGWRGAKPFQSILRPRLVPWRFLMLLAFMAWVAVMAHLVALMGPRRG